MHIHMSAAASSSSSSASTSQVQDKPYTQAKQAQTSSSNSSAYASLDALYKDLELDKEMDTKYDSQKVEQIIYSWWERAGCFVPSESDMQDPNKTTFMMAMPPPNVTGGLHMGHAMFSTIEDIITRYRRMKGDVSLWLPGTDHAGIATQLLVERAMAKEDPPVKRRDLGRDEFLRRVWEWKSEKGGYITQQLRRLGASCDWTRERFTMDEQCSEAVVEAFVRLYEKGLIYRGEYMVNWSPNLQTAVSDLEVEFSEEKGTLYFFKYMLAGSDEFIPVATTRPETILGDTAVCINPNDERYKKYLGKKVVVPILGREIPVIADDYVDPEFGTGVVKITPAHDPNDYEIGKRHNLELINIMNDDATINAQGGERYSGLDRFVCREKLWKDMKEGGLVVKEEDHVNRVPRSQRGGEIIEPRVSTQWFVKMESLAKPALEAVRTGEIRFVPERFEKVYYNWLENIHDWCISRQLWWGHRVPVWHVAEHPGEFIVARSAEDAETKAKAKYGKAVTLQQDSDVLDTWFSSGLWPFATLGWPKKTLDLERFYPNVVMETGYDILFFWVARMIMMGIEFMGKPPFSVVYMHGLVRDSKGKKMSKTIGNVIDPLDMIASYGTDALRYTLVTGSTPGQDVPLSEEKIESNRNFANKLWNAGRFILGNLTRSCTPEEMTRLTHLRTTDFGKSPQTLESLRLPERYIISKLHALSESVSKSLDDYAFGESGRLVQEFLWDEFADWYIEISKTRLNAEGVDEEIQKAARSTLVYVFDSCLRLLHPFMPFVTEAVWQRLPHNAQVEPALISAAWPERNLPVDEESIRMFNRLQALVRSIRNARSEYQVEPAKRIGAVVLCENPVEAEAIRLETPMMALLAKIEPSLFEVRAGPSSDAEFSTDSFVQLVIGDGLIAQLPLKELIDVEKETARLKKQLEKLEKDFEGLSRRMNAPGFADKAPAAVVAQTKEQSADLQERISAVKKRLVDVQNMK